MTKFFSESEFDGDVTHPIAARLQLSLPDMELPRGLLDLAVQANTDEGESPNSFTIYAFSESADTKGVLFILYGQMNEGIVSNFTLNARRRPTEPPPPSAIEGNQKTGGYPEALDRIFSLFPKKTVKCKAAGQFYCPTSPLGTASKEKFRGGFQLTGKKLLFEAANPIDGTKIFAIVDSWPAPEGVMVETEANIEITFSPFCIEEAANLLWQQISPLVKADDQ